MKAWRSGLSKSSTSIRVVLGVSLAAIVLVLFHERPLRADSPGTLPRKAFESSYFPSCKGVPLMERADYLNYLDDHLDPDPRIQAIPEDGFVPEAVHDDLSKEEFLEKVSSRILRYLEINAFHAEALQACVRYLDSKDEAWFRALGRDPKKYAPYCTEQIANLIRGVESRWSRMRIALSLVGPSIREDVVIPEITTRVNTRPRHPLGDVAKMPPLTSDEESTALAQFSAEEQRLRQEYRSKPHFWQTQVEEDRYVIRGLEPFRAEQKKLYWKLLSEMPILVLVSNGKPNADDLLQALKTIQESAEKTLATLKARASRDFDLYASYTNLIDGILKDEPKYCALAHGWEARLDRNEKVSLGARIGISLLAGLEAKIADALIVRFGAELIGVATNATYIYGNFEDYEIARSKAFSSVLNQEGVADFETLSRDRKRMILASILLPAKVVANAIR